MSTYKALKSQMTTKGWSLQETSEKSNLPDLYLERVLQGGASLTHKAASKLARAFGCEIWEVDPSRVCEEIGDYE